MGIGMGEFDMNYESQFIPRKKLEVYYLTSSWERIRDKHLFKYTKCFVCELTRFLHVHHLTYERLHQEREDDLVTVCKFCHKIIHHVAKNYYLWLNEIHITLKDSFNAGLKLIEAEQCLMSYYEEKHKRKWFKK